jgi:hypothetical protein
VTLRRARVLPVLLGLGVAAPAGAQEACPPGVPLNVNGAPAAVTFPAISREHFAEGSVQAPSPISVTVTSGHPWHLCLAIGGDPSAAPRLEWSEDGRVWRSLGEQSFVAASRPAGSAVPVTLLLRMRLSWRDDPQGRRTSTLLFAAVPQP